MKRFLHIVTYTMVVVLFISLHSYIANSQIRNHYLDANIATYDRRTLMERETLNIENSTNLPYIGRNLTVFKHLYLFYNAFANVTQDILRFGTFDYPYDILPTGLDSILQKYLYSQNYTCGGLVSVERYYNETYNVIILNATYSYCRLTWTSLGYIYFTYMDGVVNNLYVLNEAQLNKTMDDLLIFVYHYYFGWLELLDSWGIFYAGVSADSVVREMRQEFLVINDTLTPVTNVYVRLVNPYYKFYMVFNGVRFAYPIMIGIEDINGKPVLKFLKLVIPAQMVVSPNADFGWVVIKKDFAVKDNYTYVDLIVLKIRELLNNTSISAEDIVVADIYYDYTPDFKQLYPYLEVYVNTTTGFVEVIRFKLTYEEPVVDAGFTLAGLPSPSDPSYLLIESMLSTRQRYVMRTVGEEDLGTYILVVSEAIIVLIIVVITIAYMRKET